MQAPGKASEAPLTVMATAEERRVHHQILNRMGGVEKGISHVQAVQTAQSAAQRPISMLHGIPPPYFYGDEGEDVEAFIYALVNCANANDWKDNKTVNNLAHFLDGRAGYAFRAAVEHRVQRAQGSQKERLEERRKQLEKLTALEAEKTAAGDEVRRLAVLQASLRGVKEEEKGDASEEGRGSEESNEEMQKLERKYHAAMELFSVASVNFSLARKESKDRDWVEGTQEAATPKEITGDSDHSIAFPTLNSALQWLRVTFRREDVEDRLTGEYFGRRQRRSEKVQDYALELLKLCSRAGIAATEEKKTQHFVDGLRPRLKRTLKHYILAGRINVSKGNWEETVKEASKLEREHPFLTSTEEDDAGYRTEVNAVSAAPAAAMAAPPAGGQGAYEWSKLMADVAALTDAVAQAASDAPGKHRDNQTRSMRCYNCHELGHMSWECPQEDSRNTRSFRQSNPRPVPFHIVCYNCGGKGHYAAGCTKPKSATAPRPQATGRRLPERRGDRSTGSGAQPQRQMQGNGPRA